MKAVDIGLMLLAMLCKSLDKWWRDVFDELMHIKLLNLFF